jgi:hypothetical protein
MTGLKRKERKIENEKIMDLGLVLFVFKFDSIRTVLENVAIGYGDLVGFAGGFATRKKIRQFLLRREHLGR